MLTMRSNMVYIGKKQTIGYFLKSQTWYLHYIFSLHRNYRHNRLQCISLNRSRGCENSRHHITSHINTSVCVSNTQMSLKQNNFKNINMSNTLNIYSFRSCSNQFMFCCLSLSQNILLSLCALGQNCNSSSQEYLLYLKESRS